MLWRTKTSVVADTPANTPLACNCLADSDQPVSMSPAACGWQPCRAGVTPLLWRPMVQPLGV